MKRNKNNGIPKKIRYWTWVDILFIVLIAGCVCILILSLVYLFSKKSSISRTPQEVVCVEKIDELENGDEVWRKSTYHIQSIKTDTIHKRVKSTIEP